MCRKKSGILNLQRQTFFILNELTAPECKDGSEPLTLHHSTFSRFKFVIINADKKATTSNIPVCVIPEILESAIKMVSGCPCEDGCPACVGDYNLDKKTVLWGLDNLLEESEPPVYLKKNIKEPQPVIRKEFSFFNLPDEWEKVCYAVVKNGEAGGQFLKTIKKVSTEGHKLILTMENEFYAKWLMEPDNLQSLTNTLRYHVICPADMQIRVRYEAKMDEQEKKERQKKRDRLQRRYDEQLGNE